ncbi:cyclic GMP-AMP synthase-like receptor isoform X1 [Achroia grisella]|uniref:cyclic GMP-AMP synthase-like receptor isoform X1 n=1 Tax=Achroia grisella TaxID=688607 RepID=UPI0027D22AEB|nr:cyclic GMP-AMP synthase-like receptor isoform X1 [Achroia grisella]
MSNKKKNYLDLYLTEIHNRYVSLKKDHNEKALDVFNSVFAIFKNSMKKYCNYFNHYSTEDMLSGSVYDGTKVSKLDEFDMDIVIRLPINYDEGENGITIENEEAGYVKLKITNAFDNLAKQSNWENRHVVIHSWRDNEGYLRQDKFRSWIQGVAQKAMNEFNGQVTVNGVTYSLESSQSGPAYTLKIASLPNDQPFKLDVDLVPCIKFDFSRWPEGYRKPAIQERSEETNTNKDKVRPDKTSEHFWLAVPKPNKAIEDPERQNRCWRLSFQDFERDLMRDCQNLKTTMKLVKKIRDVLDMKAIASYFIKTLFLWKISQTNKMYWNTKLSDLLKAMLEELYNAINRKNIPYYWQEDNNLIQALSNDQQQNYTRSLKDVLDSFQSNDMDGILIALLTKDELAQFKGSNFYRGGTSRAPRPQRSQVNVDADRIAVLENTLKELNEKLSVLTVLMNDEHIDDETINEYREVREEACQISNEIEEYRFKYPTEQGRGWWKKALMFLALLPLVNDTSRRPNEDTGLRLRHD